MCGIAGFIDFNKKSTESNVKSMIEPLTHRGPDGEGTLLLNNDHSIIGLGHKRLSIIDLSSNGKQPMSFGHLHLTYNGEIYNFQEIKNELVALGYSFSGESDTEMILHAYLEWGIKAIEKFIGMFAIVLFDEKQNELFLIRDRAGVKPLFYYNKKTR